MGKTTKELKKIVGQDAKIQKEMDRAIIRHKANQEFDEYMKKSEKKEPKTPKKREEYKKKIERIEQSLYIDKDTIAEQVYKEGKNQFCIYDTKTKMITYKNNIGDIHPIEAQEIKKGAVLLPSQAEEYKNEEELDQQILIFIKKWLDIPKDDTQFALWNIKRSWVYERFHTLNYLRPRGDTGQGKTRYLDTLGIIHYKPINITGATTSAPVFRIIDKWKGTLIIDEADFKLTDETALIMKIINQGYEKGKFIPRCDQNDANRIDFFDPYCPKIIATRKGFTDKATESRCITTIMTGTKRDDIPYNLNDDFYKEAESIRNKLLMWRFKNYFKINQCKEGYKGFEEIEPRLKQIFNSFVSLFNDNKKKMEEFNKFILEKQEEIIDERRNSFAGDVIEGIHNLIQQGHTNISNKDIIETAGLTDYKNQPLKPRGLNQTLKSLGFKKAELVRLDNKIKRCIPLEKEHLFEVFKRYGFCNDVTIVTVLMGSSFYKKKGYNKGNVTIGELPDSNVTTVTTLQDKSTDTIVTTDTNVFKRLVDNVLSECHSCGKVDEPLAWEDDKGSMYCDTCKNSILFNEKKKGVVDCKINDGGGV